MVNLREEMDLRNINIECSKKLKWNLYVWAERANLGGAKTALKFKYEI